MRPFDVVEGPTKLLDLRAEPLAIGPVLLALGSEAVGLAAEDLDVPRLFLCLMEMLLEADMLVTVRPFDVVEGPTKLLDLRAEPLDFGPVSLALGSEAVALYAEDFNLSGLLSRLLELLLEPSKFIAMHCSA